MPNFEEELKDLILKHSRTQLKQPFDFDSVNDSLLVKYIYDALHAFKAHEKENKERFNKTIWEYRQKENIEQILKEGGFYK